MLSLANARSAEELRAWIAADAQPPGARGDRGSGRSSSSPSRRSTASRSRCIYRDGVLRARGDARQRRGRRGRHPQPAHDRRDPAAARDGRPAAAGRGARRGVHVAAGLRRAQRAPRRGRALDVHEPAQLGGRDDPPARPQAGRRAAAVAVGYGIGVTEGLALRRPLGGAAVAARAPLPRAPGRQEARRPRRRSSRSAGTGSGAAASLDFEIDGVVVKVDDFELQRRLGVVGRDPRWAIAWKFPPTTAVTRLNGIGLEPGQVRRPASLRDARAGARRRRDGQAGDAAQRGGSRPQGHPRGRGRDRAARRRRDPAGRSRRRPHVAEHADRPPPPAPPERCPVCDTPTVKPEGSVFTHCPNRDCPGRRWQLLKHFVGAMDIDGLGEKQVSAVHGPRAGCARRPTSTASTPEQIAELAGFGEVSAEQAGRGDRGVASERPFGRACCSRSGSRRSASVTGRNLAQQFRTLDALLAADAGGRSSRRRGSGRRWPRRSTTQLPTRRCAR